MYFESKFEGPDKFELSVKFSFLSKGIDLFIVYVESKFGGPDKCILTVKFSFLSKGIGLSHTIFA